MPHKRTCYVRWTPSINLLQRFCSFLSCWLLPLASSAQQWLSWLHQKNNEEQRWLCSGLHILRALIETASSKGKTERRHIFVLHYCFQKWLVHFLTREDLTPPPAESVCDRQCVTASPSRCVSSSAEWSPPPNGPAISHPVSQWFSHVSGSSPSLHCTSSLKKAEVRWRSAHSPPGLFGLSANRITWEREVREFN